MPRCNLHSFLWLCLLVVSAWMQPVQAQDTAASSNQNQMALRLIENGRFLPSGTVVVVLQKESRVLPPQPEFMTDIEYPHSPSYVVRWDTLDASGRTRHTYPSSAQSGLVYFIYARTPRGQLYWSYSTLRNSITFDVATTGVMSVARVDDAEIRSTVLDLYFAPDSPPATAAAPPSDAEPSPPDTETPVSPDVPASLDTLAAADTLASRRQTDAEIDAWLALSNPSSTEPAPADTAATDGPAGWAGPDFGALFEAGERDIVLSRNWLYGIAGLVFIVLLISALLVARAYRHLQYARYEAQALRAEMLDQQAANTAYIRKLERAVVEAIERPDQAEARFGHLRSLYAPPAPAEAESVKDHS